jgi:protein-S-isoprenylcysteine O-methyltransferase Ste14
VSLIPAFELGLWNAWILVLPMIVLSVFGSKILGKRKSEEGLGFSKKEKILTVLYLSFIILLYVYSVFLPLKLEAIWFVIGLLIYLPVMFFVTIGLLNFANTPVDELVTRGVYSISRNPMYVGDFLVTVSIGIACLSWVFLLVAIVNLLLLRNVVVAEERFLLEKYGAEYRDYINRTPRWIGLPKSEKKE